MVLMTIQRICGSFWLQPSYWPTFFTPKYLFMVYVLFLRLVMIIDRNVLRFSIQSLDSWKPW
jgi:hypothetical protein